MQLPNEREQLFELLEATDVLTSLKLVRLDPDADDLEVEYQEWRGKRMIDKLENYPTFP